MERDLKNEYHLFGNLNGPLLLDNMIRLEPNTNYDICCRDCNHPEHNQQDRNKGINLNNFPDPDLTYKINNYGYRSDNFIENNKDEYLFSGCSVTFGHGVPYNTSWAYLFNEYLSGNKFYNLAQPGTSAKLIIDDVYAYIRKFGKPKGVFLNFPKLNRILFFGSSKAYESDSHDYGLKINFYNDGFESINPGMPNLCPITRSEEVRYYEFLTQVYALEDYLEALEIPMIWTSWDPTLDHVIKDVGKAKNYISVHDLDSSYFNEDIPKHLLQSKYWDKARDIEHPAISEQYAYYLAFKKEWERREG